MLVVRVGLGVSANEDKHSQKLEDRDSCLSVLAHRSATFVVLVVRNQSKDSFRDCNDNGGDLHHGESVGAKIDCICDSEHSFSLEAIGLALQLPAYGRAGPKGVHVGQLLGLEVGALSGVIGLLQETL